MERHIFSVTEVNELVKLLLDNEPMLSGICVRGEISNYKMYPSGHHYFSLKDPTGAIRCVMFKGQALRLRFRPENGMKVLVTGRVSVFPRDGAYQLYCDTMTPEGAGDLALAFEQLKEQLYKEGLFDEAHKKPLPQFPERIAVVTSSAGAAVHDMIRILRRRYPLAKVILLPVRVQGAEAPPEIAGAIRYADKWKIGDVIITGRGGGSMEDLWAFNDERLARAIAASPVPVVSAIGHETDFTLADFAADLRAPTPSVAAELLVPDWRDLLARVQALQRRLATTQAHRLRNAMQRADRAALRLHALRPQARLEMLRRRQEDAARRLHALWRDQQARRQAALRHADAVLRAHAPRRRLEQLRARLLALAPRPQAAVARTLQRDALRLRALARSLEAVSPLATVARGYALITKEDGTLVRSVTQVQSGDTVDARLADGKLKLRLE